MIAINDKAFSIFLLHSGYNIIDYRSVGRYNGKDDMAYIFNERTRISLLKELYEQGKLNILERGIYYKKISGQQEEFADLII